MASVSWDYHSYRHKVRYQVQEGRKAFRKLPPLHLVHRTYAYDPSWYQLFGLMEAEQVLELLSRVSRMKQLQGIRLAQKPENPPPVLTDEERYRRRKQKKRIMRENRIQRHHMIPDDGAGHVLSKHFPFRPKLHRDGQLIEHTDSPPDGPQSAQKSPWQVIPTPG